MTDEENTLTDICSSVDGFPLKKLIDSAAGRIRLVGININPGAEYEGAVTVLQSELIAMQAAAKQSGYDDITDLEFDIIVSYLSESGVVQTDKVVNASVTEAPNSIKEGDLYSEHALPFIACDIEYNVT